MGKGKLSRDNVFNESQLCETLPYQVVANTEICHSDSFLGKDLFSRCEECS